MKNTIIKLISLIILCATVLLCFAACGGQQIAADANGEMGNISWKFTQSNQTLTLDYKGDPAKDNGMMTNQTMKSVTETNEKWAGIRSSVTKVVIEDGFTSIGDYVFYGMSYLQTVEIPETVTKIGKCSFAFCLSLWEIDFPSALTDIGESAFEGCYVLGAEPINDGKESIVRPVKLPESLKTIGERAFAFCRNIHTLLIPAKLSGDTPLKKWAFKDCTALNTLALHEDVKTNYRAKLEADAGKALSDSEFDKKFNAMYADAFTGSGMPKNTEKVKYVTYTEGTTIYVWRYIYDTAKEKYVVYDKIAPDDKKPDVKVDAPYKTDTKSFGDKYSYTAPKIDGYVLDTSMGKDKYSGTVITLGSEQVFKFHYKKAEATKPSATDTNTAKPEDTTPESSEDGMGTGTIVALCIFAVVIVGVCGAAFFVIRSDKKNNKSRTVRKNGNDKNKKK